MANKFRLDINHRDKARMEAFLGMLNEEFECVPFDWKSWNQADIIVDATKLINIDQSLIITILFLESYSAADVLAKANALPSDENARWSVNGAVMYLVESPDRNKVNHVLSIFAGDEQPKKISNFALVVEPRDIYFVIDQTLPDKYLTQINDVADARHEKESKHILFIKLAREGAHEDVDQ